MPAETQFDDAYLTAAEYVCGLTTAEERRTFERRIERDATFRAMVRTWEGQLASLNATYESAKPPNVWAALDKAIFAPRRRKRWLTRLAIAAAAVAALAKVLLLLQLF